MRRLLTVLTALFLASPLLAQTGGNAGSTKAAQEFAKALTASTHFGVPRYTTVALPTCNTANTGAVAFNTTSGFLNYCNGTSWGVANSGAASAITPGSTTVGTATNCFAFADASSLLQCDNTLAKLDNSGAGVAAFTLQKTMSGGSAISNFLSFVGTTPTVLTASARAVSIRITGAGSSAQSLFGLEVALAAGYTGNTITSPVRATNASAGTGAWSTSWGFAVGNGSLYGQTTGVTAGTNFGSVGLAGGGNINIGVFGHANVAKDSATAAGVVGIAANSGATPVRVGGYFGLNTAAPTLIESALVADNSAVAAPIIVARDNGAALPTTGATATWQVMDGAWSQAGNGVLTNATMAAETQGRASGGLIHSYTWTNAQVAALAGTAGDITVATLPAKTQLRNAYVVITGQAAGPTTVTVSCGDAIAGTPFINYVVASDAKVAANTVYGDAVGERGTSIDVEWYYLPSYTATTLVTCHWISTGGNLSTVTGSTGRLILETSVLP